MQIQQAQQSMLNAVDYRDKFITLSNAGVGVILTRCREPFRAIDTLRAFAFAENPRYSFYEWTVTAGWKRHDPNQSGDIAAGDGTVDPFMALRALTDPQNPVSQQDMAIYVMMYPHKPLNAGHPGMIQLLKEYVRSFPEIDKRLILLTPLGFNLPAELQDDVVLLDFDVPSYAELEVKLDETINSVKDERKRPRLNNEFKKRIVSLGTGMTGFEFETAVARALASRRPDSKIQLPNIDEDHFASILAGVKTEVIKRSEVLELMETEDIANIGGLDNLKSWMGKRAKAFSDEAAEYGITPPKGVALIGPPGTGKSLMAKAVASILSIPAIRFDISRIFKSLVGESESRVREALKLVDSMAPAVLLIDEVDKALGGAHGSSGDSGVSSRVLGSILTWMQDTKAPVFVVVTANRVNNLPSEFLRKGRLDEVFSVSVPDDKERMEILQIHLRKRGHNPNKIKGLKSAVDRSAGYVPAELEAAVKDALIEAFADGKELTGDLITEQISNMQPLSVAFADDFAAMQRWAEQNARPSSSGERPAINAAITARQRTRQPSTGHRVMNLDG